MTGVATPSPSPVSPLEAAWTAPEAGDRKARFAFGALDGFCRAPSLLPGPDGVLAVWTAAACPVVVPGVCGSIFHYGCASCLY